MRLRKIVVERVTVVKFRVDNGGSDGSEDIIIYTVTESSPEMLES